MAVLKLHMTYGCTAACAHCRFWCERAPGTVIEETLALRAVRELNAALGLDLVVLMGGEPGMSLDLTQRLTDAIAGQGIGVRIETNAFWATDLDAARSWLAPFVRRNAEIMLSLDAFHEPFVPPENVAHALHAAADLGGHCVVEMAYLERPGADNPYDRRSDALLAMVRGKLNGQPVVPNYQGTVFFNGRASAMLSGHVSRGRGVPRETCLAVPWWAAGEYDTFDLLILDPDGYLSKGCGIALGNVRDCTVETVLGAFDADTHPIFATLRKTGPFGLAQEARELGYVLKPDYADKCHLCQEARTILRERYPEWLTPAQHYAP